MPRWPQSFARSRREIDDDILALQPSRLGCWVSVAWLSLATIACSVGGPESLTLRLFVAAIVLSVGARGIWGAVWMRGSHAIGAIRWNTDGHWWVYMSASGTWQTATLTRSTAQWGARWIWLGMSTPTARYSALIDRSVVDVTACTRLIWALRARRGRVHPASG
jgi:hypothetical protein